jgi:transposase
LLTIDKCDLLYYSALRDEDRAFEVEGIVMGGEVSKKSMILTKVSMGTLTLKQAAGSLELSYRQVKRLWKRFCEEGDHGLAHRNRGRTSNRAYRSDLREEILRRYRENALGCGPTRFSESLRAQGISVNHETLRRWLLESGLWKLSRNRRPRQHANRFTGGFGERLILAAVEGSWLGAGGAKSFLLCLRDEATGIARYSLASEPSGEAAMHLLWSWIDRHGIPMALRCPGRLGGGDDRDPGRGQQAQAGEPLADFSRSCDRLGIDTDAPDPAQAESVLVELRPLAEAVQNELIRRGASTVERGNVLLEGPVSDVVNRCHASRPEAGADCHVRIVDGTDLRRIFCTERELTFRELGSPRRREARIAG